MIEIECPHCNKHNAIRLPENATCRHCKCSFDERVFSPTSLKTIMKSGTVALLAGSAIGYFVEDKLDAIRYKPEFEFAIISQCANSRNSYIPEIQLQRNIYRCSCALEKTMKEVGYKYNIDEQLSESFRKNLLLCK